MLDCENMDILLLITIGHATPAVTSTLRASENSSQNNVNVFITGTHSTTSSKNIEDHLTTMGIVGCTIQDLSRQGHDVNWKSFKVSVPASEKGIVLNQSNWSERVRTRLFRPRNQPFRNNQPFRDNRVFSFY